MATAGRPVDILMLGLGGGLLHSYTKKHCPEWTRVRSVEIDPRLAAVASRYFGLQLVAGASEVVVDDAFNAVHRAAAAAHERSLEEAEENADEADEHEQTDHGSKVEETRAKAREEEARAKAREEEARAKAGEEEARAKAREEEARAKAREEETRAKVRQQEEARAKAGEE